MEVMLMARTRGSLQQLLGPSVAPIVSEATINSDYGYSSTSSRCVCAGLSSS